MKKKKSAPSSSTAAALKLPEELPSVEEMLKKLAAAINTLETPGLSKAEVTRLRNLLQPPTRIKCDLQNT